MHSRLILSQKEHKQNREQITIIVNSKINVNEKPDLDQLVVKYSVYGHYNTYEVP